jgi:hypothetical protein
VKTATDVCLHHWKFYLASCLGLLQSLTKLLAEPLGVSLKAFTLMRTQYYELSLLPLSSNSYTIVHTLNQTFWPENCRYGAAMIVRNTALASW